MSAQPKLYLLVLLALTTGARRGKRTGLRRQNLDLSAGTAHIALTRKGHPRVLPLRVAVIAEMKRHGTPHAGADLFASRYSVGRLVSFDTAWSKVLRLALIEESRYHDLRPSGAGQI